MTSLSNKVAFVTGGSRGIGAAIVRRLARDGAAVAFTYQSSGAGAQQLVESIQAAGGRAHAYQADAADAAAVTRAINEAANHFGKIDILVNNAGVLFLGPVDQFSLEDFDKTLAVNVRAVFVASKAALAHMGEGGRIINIGSTNADRMPFPGGAAYAMSKSALKGLVQGMARDLGPKGHYRQQRAAGPGEYGYESGNLRLRAIASWPDGIAATCTARRNCQHGGVSGRPGIELCHRCKPERGRRICGLTAGQSERTHQGRGRPFTAPRSRHAAIGTAGRWAAAPADGMSRCGDSIEFNTSTHQYINISIPLRQRPCWYSPKPNWRDTPKDVPHPSPL